MHLNRDYYCRFKNRALTKATGANIHKIYGLLANISSGITNSGYWTRIGNKELAAAEVEIAKEAMSELRDITGLSTELTALIIST